MHNPYGGVPHAVRNHAMLPGRLPLGSMDMMHHYPGHAPFGSAHYHSVGPSSHLPSHALNGYHLSQYDAATLHHPNAAFTAIPTSTLTAHAQRQPSSPAILTSLSTPLSKDEFYLKQRDLRRR